VHKLKFQLEREKFGGPSMEKRCSRTVQCFSIAASFLDYRTILSYELILKFQLSILVCTRYCEYQRLSR
jgi:hypothetical protein